jgi:putative Mn2+ efflux pump MntP
MTFFNIFLIAVALSFDAMAVSAVSGARYHNMPVKKALRIALFFGFFQLLMPLIGWGIGLGLEKIITKYDHWVAFLLLFGIGLKMIFESFKSKEEKNKDINNLKILFLLAIATSIDALVVGMTFGLIPVNIWFAVLVIGITTFLLSLISVYIGKKCGETWSQKAEIIGGLILVGIGVNILINHLII